MNFILLYSFGSNPNVPDGAKNPLKINWVQEMPGNFSFRHKWSYPENIFRNKYGQLICDGNCPSRADGMRNAKGKIFKDSLEVYYQLIDTSHQYHALESKCNCGEWPGEHFIQVQRTVGDTIECFTKGSVSTHCLFKMTIVGDDCYPQLKLNSIVPNSDVVYQFKDGYMLIDQNLWQKGILQANFRFIFTNPKRPEKDIYWSGKMYKEILKS